MRGMVPNGVADPAGLMIEISLPSVAPSDSASREPIATCSPPGVSLAKDPRTSLPLSVSFSRMSLTVMPRTIANSTRPLRLANSGCSISGIALVMPGVLRASATISRPIAQLAAIALDHGMAVEPGDLVEQLGAEAIHHAHHDDQRGDAEHHRDEAEPPPPPR